MEWNNIIDQLFQKRVLNANCRVILNANGKPKNKPAIGIQNTFLKQLMSGKFMVYVNKKWGGGLPHSWDQQ